MESVGIYLLRSGISITLLYLFYWLFLRNETYYSWNRIYLLTSMISALVFPVFRFPMHINAPVNLMDTINPILTGQQNVTGLPLSSTYSISILSIIYISGAVFFFLRFLSGLFRIRYLFNRFPRHTIEKFKTVVLDSDQSPFTFFNILFISRNDLEGGKIDEMIVHEKAHRDGYHTFDIILLELLTIVHWFNPFIWLLRYSLRSEHEFIADNKVVDEGYDKFRYQKLLLSKSLGVTSAFLANNFNYSLLKKRFTMMTKNKSAAWVRVKYLLSMPILLLMIAFSVLNFNAYAQKDEIFPEPEIAAKYNNGGMEGILPFIMQNIKFPESAIENNVSAKIFVQFVIDAQGRVTDVEVIRRDITDNRGKEVLVKEYKPGTNPNINPAAVADLEAEALRVVKLLKGFTPAQNGGKNVKTQFTIPIAFALGEGK